MSKTFLEVCEMFQNVENTPSRLEMTSLMSDFFKQCNNEEVQMISYLVQGRVSPMFVDAEFNYSEKSIIKMLKNLNKDVELIRNQKGDIGDTVFAIGFDIKRSPKEKTLSEVYSILWSIVNSVGTGSQDNKSRIVYDFISSSSDIENKYFVRIVASSLRLGLSDKTLLDVFSYYIAGDKEYSEILTNAYGLCGDLGYIASKIIGYAKDRALDNLNNIEAQPGVPILSRLVQRVGSFEEVFERMREEVLVQPKYDGLRLQIHKIDNFDYSQTKTVWSVEYSDSSNNIGLFGESNARVKLFSRNLEDVTDLFPEIVEEVKQIPQKSFILDSEVLGWDYEKNRFLSYQETMQRRRKYDIESKKESIPVKAFVFDVLYLNGKDITKIDTFERVKVLEEITISRSIEVAKTDKVNSVDNLAEIFRSYVEDGLEGIIVKKLDGGYTPGARNYDWIKLKKSMDKGLVDTVDMVVVGYYHGSGRRADIGIGSILGAIYNEKEGRYDAICKVGTGITDELFNRIYSDLEGIRLKGRPNDVQVDKLLEPDVWVEPKFVITVEADEITADISKNKGLGGGLSLRFPRLLEWDRDKEPQGVTSVSELVDIFRASKK